MEIVADPVTVLSFIVEPFMVAVFVYVLPVPASIFPVAFVSNLRVQRAAPGICPTFTVNGFLLLIAPFAVSESQYELPFRYS